MEELWKAATSKEVIAPLKKVPGEVKPSGKLEHEVHKFRESIRCKSLQQLQELLKRQEDILKNEKLMSKLPDKGAKIEDKRREIQTLISEKSKIQDTADLMGNLKLIDTDAMEWKHGGSGPLFKTVSEPSDNVFRTLATKEVPDKLSMEYAQELACKMDQRVFCDDLEKAPFQQIKRTQLDQNAKENIPLQRSEKDAIKSRRIEVMPLPPSNYQQLKVQHLPLKESMELQKEHMKRLKEAQIKSAIDRLTSAPISSSEKHQVKADKMAYREQTDAQDSDDSDQEDQENQGYEIKASDDEGND